MNFNESNSNGFQPVMVDHVVTFAIGGRTVDLSSPELNGWNQWRGKFLALMTREELMAAVVEIHHMAESERRTFAKREEALFELEKPHACWERAFFCGLVLGGLIAFGFLRLVMGGF